ncbi:Replication protein O [Nostoc flagelliforme CCNUN1]|uniref:Replication protein O n=1 Tax=Nostoc flagelliforme CCNUN1 TaxID=2038116 RepID=A0A2K8T458_9NOSO|nr:hypothetical protein [Nostoc flagelliforme]AUB42451.1 Replication protein O [Nostoc flagelliforme CCNUN1]
MLNSLIVDGDTLHSTVSAKFRDWAYSQAVLKECTRGVGGSLVVDIAYLKEALQTWTRIKSPEAVFVAACKEGRKVESAQVKSAAFVADVGAAIAWFEWARKERIVIAMSGETVYTLDGRWLDLRT